MDPGHEFRKGERLYQVIVRAEFQPFHSIPHAVTRSQEQDWRLEAGLTELADDGPTVFLRQHHVYNQEVVFPSPRELEPGLAIMGDLDGELVFAQTLGQKSSRLFLVFDEQ